MEAVFQSLIGVDTVEQGFISAKENKKFFSEGVIVHFNEDEVSLKTLIEIHLHTHKSTVNHSRRDKYVSAIYGFSKEQRIASKEFLTALQSDFAEDLVTEVLDFHEFNASEEIFHNYYYSNPDKPFCKTYIDPKLEKLLSKFSHYTLKNKLGSQRNGKR